MILAPHEQFLKIGIISYFMFKVLGEKAQDVVMTSKLENQPGMITVWNLGVVRNFLRQQKMTNPDNKDLFEEEELAKIATPKLQLSKTHPGIF